MRFDSTQLKELEMIPILIKNLTTAINNYLKFDIKISFIVEKVDGIIHIKLLEEKVRDFHHDFELKWKNPHLSLWNESIFELTNEGQIIQILLKSNHRKILGHIKKI